MSNICPSVRIQKAEPYQPGDQNVTEKTIKLNTNENPFPPSPAVIETLKNLSADLLRRYPPPLAQNLRATIAEKEGIDPRNVVIGNGSDEILSLLIRTYLDAGDMVTTFYPNYSFFDAIASLHGICVQTIPWGERENVNARRISRSKIFYMVRPHSPTGESLSLDIVEEWLKAAENQLCIVDEAYSDFAEDTVYPLLQKYSNLVIVRTLSKSYSLAGLRCGWLISSDDIAQNVLKLKDSYNVGIISQRLAQVALEDDEYMRTCVANVCRGRNKLTQAMTDIGFQVLPSEANFIYACHPRFSGDTLFSSLRKNDILVRHFSYKGYRDYIRITISKPDDMVVFMDKLRSIVK